MSWFCALIPEVDDAVELKMDDWGCTLASGPDSGNLLDNLDDNPAGIGKGHGVWGAEGAGGAVVEAVEAVENIEVGEVEVEVEVAAPKPGVGKRSITEPLD